MIRQQLIEELTREIMNYDAEYRPGRKSAPCVAVSLRRAVHTVHTPHIGQTGGCLDRPGGMRVASV